MASGSMWEHLPLGMSCAARYELSIRSRGAAMFMRFCSMAERQETSQGQIAALCQSETCYTLLWC